MNAAVRFAAGLGPRDQTSDAQRKPNWEQIEQRITYKLCVMVRSGIIGTAAAYTSDTAISVSELGGVGWTRHLLWPLSCSPSLSLGLHNVELSCVHVQVQVSSCFILQRLLR